MTMRKNVHRRAFTLVEMCVAMAVMGIVMSFAALEFKAVVFTYLNADSHLSSEQQARVAIAKLSDLTHQASVVNNPDPNVSPQPAIILPAGNTPGPTLQFTMAQSLDPSSLPTPGGVPKPCYDLVTVSINPISAANDLVEQVEPWDSTRTECTQGFTFGSHLIARNVEAFTVARAECDLGGNNCTYGQGYRIDISTFDYDDNAADSHAGALYHLSSVITPLTFGESK